MTYHVGQGIEGLNPPPPPECHGTVPWYSAWNNQRAEKTISNGPKWMMLLSLVPTTSSSWTLKV